MEFTTTGRRKALLGWAAVAVAVLALLAWGEQRASAQEVGPPPGVVGVERGGLLYAQHCAQCHGAGGRGGPMPQYEGVAPPLLPELNPDVTVAYLDLVMSTGRMPPAGSPYNNQAREIVLGPEERADLIAWMQREFDTPGRPIEIDAGDPAVGQDVWNTNCAHCHGATGAGGVAGAGAWTPPVYDSSAQTIAQAIRVGPFEMPQFGQAQITDEEAAGIVAYMNEIEDEEGTPILGLVELNPVFASGFVALLALAVFLSLIWIGGRPAWFPDPSKSDREPEVPAGAKPRSGGVEPQSGTEARPGTEDGGAR